MTQVSLGTAVLAQLGLSALDTQVDEATAVLLESLSELDARRPELGIRERVLKVLKEEEPVEQIAKLVTEFRVQLQG